MKFVRGAFFATAVALFTLATPTFAQQVSPAVGNALKIARASSSSSGVAAAISKAQAAASTPTEKRIVTQMAASEFARVRDYKSAVSAGEAAGLPAITMAQLYYGAGNLAKAVEKGNQAGGKAGITVVAQSFVRMGNAPKAAEAYKRLIAVAGPQREYLSNLAAQQSKAGDKAGFQKTLEQLIRVDPSPRNWAGVLSGMKSVRMPDQAKLGLYMLIQETGNLSASDEVQEMAKLSMVLGAPGLAKTILDSPAGVALAADPAVGQLKGMLPQITAAAAKDLPTMLKSPMAADMMKAGRQYLGAGNYPQAIATFAKASKGTGAGAGEIALYTAIAQLRSGNIAGAKTTLGAIPAKDPYSDLGSMWKLYASTRG
jgi:hypothetical protein